MANQNNPSDKTDKKLQKDTIIKSLSAGASVTDACKGADVCRDTFYRWCNDDKDFNSRVETSKMSRIKVVEDALFNNAVNGNTTAQIFFLCNRDPDRWQHLYKIQASGNMGINTSLSDEDRKILKEIGDAFIKSKISD